MEDLANNNRQLRMSRNVRESENRTRSTPKVTDHPWLTISTSSYSEFNPSPSSSIMDTTASPTPTPNNNTSGSKYDWRMHSLMLSKHILTRGLVDGIGSDIQVLIPAWNKTYNLHRLVLDQNPYFKLLLQGSFKEADENTISLHFENENPYITTSSFQFVLEYLYGKIEEPQISQSNVKQILATSSYFQLDMCGICVDFILKHLNHQNVIDYLLFTNEFMVQGSERICDAIFTFLCREAFHMDRSILASLPLDWLKKVVESDAFWVPSEYDRYQFIKQVIQAKYTNSKSANSEIDTISHYHIITRSIYYMHMTFEQLESIEKDIHPLTKQPLVPASILKEALWSQIRLRSKIESSVERSSTIGSTISASSLQHMLDQKKTKVERLKNNDSDGYDECDFSEEEEDEESIMSRYYPIPTNDTTTYTGECAIASSMSCKKKPVVEQYSTYPPFRFSVEFSDITTLKYGMRVYSDSVFYAGSNWNMYIQKTRSQRKGALQLGVYLHRQSVSQNPNQCLHTPSVAEESSNSNNNSDSYEKVNHEGWSFSRYSDRRKVVRTWFKIYCPTRGPKHALTLFQSSPDNFSVLQSWGWRSTTLCVDEETPTHTTEEDADTVISSSSSSPPPLIYPPHTLVQYLQSTYDLKTLKSTTNNQTNMPKSSSNTLRFTVVMGHV